MTKSNVLQIINGRKTQVMKKCLYTPTFINQVNQMVNNHSVKVWLRWSRMRDLLRISLRIRRNRVGWMVALHHVGKDV